MATPGRRAVLTFGRHPVVVMVDAWGGFAHATVGHPDR